MSYNIPESALAEFFSEAEEIIIRVNTHLAKLESTGYSHEIIDSLYRDIHTLKGSAQLFGFQGIGLIGHALEASLEPIRSKRISLSGELVNGAYACLDLIDRILKKPENDLKKDPATSAEIELVITKLIEISTEGFQANYHLVKDIPPVLENLVRLKSDLTKELNQPLNGLKTSPPAIVLAQPPVAPLISNERAPLKTANTERPMPMSSDIKNPIDNRPKAEADTADAVGNETSTIRVQIGLLDRLMNLVGEMVLVRNQVLQYSHKNDDYAFQNLSQRLDLVTSELQEDVMKTRMQPIGSVLTKFQRVVRDISRELGKQIEFSVRGAETELDKGLLEAIKDPLTHIIRNSCDHGIESPEERSKTGKNQTGHVIVRAFHEGGQVVIEIADDGRGLNLPKILAKAIEKKIVPPERSNQLTDREIAQLIFAPGFSTADQVSAISGRGVGMDVVKTNIEKAGGHVDLTTEMDKGTTIRLRIPLTLAIVPAMIVNSGQQCFAIPQVKLQELVRIDMDGDGPKIEYLQGQPIFRLRGQLLPLVFINKVLSLGASHPLSNLESRILNIVILSGDGDPFGLVVDEIRDTADIVVKPLPQFLKRLNVYSGATIMGDGTVSLILDVVGVAEKANIQVNSSKKDVSIQSGASALKSSTRENQEMLFFNLNGPGRYCLPLILVQRLEEFDRGEIETSGKERIVKYRDSILPLISLNEFLNLKPQPTTPLSEKVSVIVVSKRRRHFGIEVNQIFDVLGITSDIEAPLKETPGVLGNIVVGDHIATIVDVLGIIETVIGGETGAPISARANNSHFKFKKPPRVLLAEDTPFFFKLVQKVLTDLNIEVTHALDGEAALKILRQSPPGHFDLVLSDIEMPNMNGFDLATNIRGDSQWGKIPMIALTTRFKEVDVQRGLACGFNQYLEKLKADQLVDAIRDQLGGNAL
jgi:two-component system chemotaxis sensor kinase CheA